MRNQPESSAERLPQLRMRRPTLDQLPAIQPPAPYRLRTYRPGDESAWAEIMNTGIGEGWTAERCQERLTSRSQFLPDGLFFAVEDEASGEQVAGSACAWRNDLAEWSLGYVHMVCVRPEHRGHRLGYWLTLATLHYFRERGFRQAILDTDDFRLPAIRAYLALGFAPEHTHPGHPERWERIQAELRRRG